MTATKMKSELTIDSRFAEQYSNLEQVFLYVVDRCNLHCVQCLYKPLLQRQSAKKEINTDLALSLLCAFHSLGATKLTILGGEPTLYGVEKAHEPLLLLIRKAKEYGYQYVRIDTNGVFPRELLHKDATRRLDEISFSLDGPSPEVNDLVRGAGTYARCTANIRAAVALGYRVHVTCCVHRGFLTASSGPVRMVEKFVELMDNMGVHQVNFHPVFKMGVARDTWTGETDISPDTWVQIRQALGRNVGNGRYKVLIRLPSRFITETEFNQNMEYYGYCSVKLGERILVHPDGRLRTCALSIGTPYGVGTYDEHRIKWDESEYNEIRLQNMKNPTPCTVQCRHTEGLVPLCISLKPHQDEFVWSKKIEWDVRFNANRVATPSKP